MFGERETWSRGALIPLRSPFVMGIRKKEHVIGIDRRSEPDHGFRKLAKPDIAWLLGFRKTQDSPHVFLLSLSPRRILLPMLSSRSLLSLLLRLSRPAQCTRAPMYTHPSCTPRIRPSISSNRVCKGIAIGDGALANRIRSLS